MTEAPEKRRKRATQEEKLVRLRAEIAAIEAGRSRRVKTLIARLAHDVSEIVTEHGKEAWANGVVQAVELLRKAADQIKAN